MFFVLNNCIYCYLFIVQVIVFVGIGLMMVVFGLLVYELVGVDVGVVFGMVLVIKMLVYVGVVLVVQVFVDWFLWCLLFVVLDFV